jgi:hypothetical protein
MPPLPQPTDHRIQRAAKRRAPFPSAADLHTWAAELDAVAATLAPASNAPSRAGGCWPI